MPLRSKNLNLPKSSPNLRSRIQGLWTFSILAHDGSRSEVLANIEIDKRNTEFTPSGFSGEAEVPQTVGSRDPSGANVWAKFPQERARLTARDQAVLAPGFQVVLCGYASMRMGSLP